MNLRQISILVLIVTGYIHLFSDVCFADEKVELLNDQDVSLLIVAYRDEKISPSTCDKDIVIVNDFLKRFMAAMPASPDPQNAQAKIECNPKVEKHSDLKETKCTFTYNVDFAKSKTSKIRKQSLHFIQKISATGPILETFSCMKTNSK